MLTIRYWRLFLLAFAVIITSGSPLLLAGQGASWSVVVATDAFRDRGDDALQTPVVVGDLLAVGDRLTTGSGGALVIARGEDLVTMAENSRIELMAPKDWAETVIDQPFGNVQYQVTKLKVPHFEVDSPLLATIVKGTTFSVAAGASSNSVSVTEGRVLAKNRHTGATAPVGAGEEGKVNAGGRDVSVAAASKSAPASAPSPASSGNGAGSGSQSSDKGKANAATGGKGNPGGHGSKGKSSSGAGAGSNGSGNGGNGSSGGKGGGSGGGNGGASGGGNGGKSGGGKDGSGGGDSGKSGGGKSGGHGD